MSLMTRFKEFSSFKQFSDILGDCSMTLFLLSQSAKASVFFLLADYLCSVVSLEHFAIPEPVARRDSRTPMHEIHPC